jgi:hypothetical protein
MTGGGGFFWYNRSMQIATILEQLEAIEGQIGEIKRSISQYESQETTTQDPAQFLNSLPDNQINEDQLQEIINTERQQLYEEKQRAGRS